MRREAVADLVAVLREQAARLESLLSVAEAQTVAITRRDVDTVQSLSARLERAMAEGRGLEDRRIAFADRLAAAVGAPDDEAVTLARLASLLPTRDARALLEAGGALQAVADRLQVQSRANRLLIEHELAVIDQVMRVAHRADTATYRPTGTYGRETIALLDATA